MYFCPHRTVSGISPVKADEGMTQPVGQRDGQLFTYPGASDAQFVEHDAESLEGLKAREIIVTADVITEDDSGMIQVTVTTDAGSLVFRRSSLNERCMIRAEIRGGILLLPAEGYTYSNDSDDTPTILAGATKITAVDVENEAATSIKIYER